LLSLVKSVKMKTQQFQQKKDLKKSWGFLKCARV
jgi:hypothetical protein